MARAVALVESGLVTSFTEELLLLHSDILEGAEVFCPLIPHLKREYFRAKRPASLRNVVRCRILWTGRPAILIIGDHLRLASGEGGDFMAKLILTRSQKIQAAVYTVLILGTCIFGVLFKINYDRYMDGNGSSAQSDVGIEETVDEKTHAGMDSRAAGQMRYLFIYGGFLVAFSIALGLTGGRWLSSVLAQKVVDTLHSSDDATPFLKKADYEKAEEAWTRGDFLVAIELFREYLVENPNEVHASLRIAEIYEKDIGNYLASALEYEEAIKHRLPDEQWGWTAIHLCNLYISKLNRPADALQLMKRIAQEYEFTAAAAKARQHLERLGETLEEKQELLKEASEEEPRKEPASETKKKKRKSNRNLPASEQFRDLD